MKRVDRKFTASDMLTHSPEQRELQCRQDDAEGDACSESDCIFDVKSCTLTTWLKLLCEWMSFAPSVPSQESACNSSFHVSVFNVALRWTR